MPAYTFYTKPEYFAQLIERLNAAQPGDRFMTANMVTLADNPDVAKLLDAMIAAAQRGVIVSFITDARNFLLSYDGQLPGPLLFHHRLPTRGMAREFQSLHDSIDRLGAAGVRTVVLNHPQHLLSVPIAGRCHIKFTVINDRYYIGGCNLDSPSHIDLMIGEPDPDIAGWLYDLGERMLATADSMTAIGDSDVTREVAPGVTFYLDAGVRRRSLILDEALALIDAAREHITVTCQFFPGLVTARHLKTAHKRGVKVTIHYNHVSMNRPLSALGFGAAELLERLRLPPSFFAHARRGPGYIHAKLVATEQGAMIGSHNFVKQGVDLGTAELAVKVLDPDFSRRAVEAFTKQLS